MTTTPIVNQIRRLRFGVTRQTIIALEGGRYAPSLELAFRIARTFAVGVEDVFQWPQ